MSSTPSRSYEPTASRRVAFLGLGVMGYPMAGHLARAGHSVTVYNRTASKAAAWCAEYAPQVGTQQARSAATPREAAQGADLVFCCVGNDDDLRTVTLGADGAFAGMAPGAIFVDHTTASAEVARELYHAASTLGLHFLDAPVSGGQAGAQNGQLTVMCGGDPTPFEAARPVALAFSRAFTRMGDSGSGVPWVLPAGAGRGWLWRSSSSEMISNTRTTLATPLTPRASSPARLASRVVTRPIK